MINQKFFKFDIKRSYSGIEGQWNTLDSLSMEISELFHVQNADEALQILEAFFKDAEIRNVIELTEEEVKDILY